MRDYKPRTTPLIPVGHRTWCAVSRVKERPPGTPLRDLTPNEQVEWLLEAITRPGADMSQRHDDLFTLAELLLKCRGEQVVHRRNAAGEPTAISYANGLDPNVGYGIAPIDSDTHDHDCIVCGDAEVYDEGGHDYDFDTHPYVHQWTSVWVVSWVYYQGDEQGGGGHNWWPGDTDYAKISAAFQEEVRFWQDSTAMVRLTRLQVPAFGTDEEGREAITNWIDADTDRIESGPEADMVVYSYDDADGWRIFLDRLLMLKGKGIDCAADESADIKAWMRTYPTDPLTDRLCRAFPNEWDEVGVETRADQIRPDTITAKKDKED